MLCRSPRKFFQDPVAWHWGRPRAKAAKKKKKKATRILCELLPPPDSLVEHYWPSGAAEGWYKCTCQGEEQTDEGEPASMVLDEDGNVENLYGVTLEDLQWRLISHCPHCNTNTHDTSVCGSPKCGVCNDYRDPEHGSCDSGDSDF